MARFDLKADFTPLTKTIDAVNEVRAEFTADNTQRTAHTTVKSTLRSALDTVRATED